MAFSKMVGFDVTPRRSSSSIFILRSPETSIARRILSYQMDWPSCMISVSLLLIILRPVLLDLPLRRLDHVLDGEAELLRQLLERGARAESLHGDDLVVMGRVALPAEACGQLDGDARPHRRGQNALPVLVRLVLEKLPRRDAHDARLDAFGAQQLERLDAERDFGAGRHQNDFGLAVRVGEDVAAELDVLGAREPFAVERGQRLS